MHAQKLRNKVSEIVRDFFKDINVSEVITPLNIPVDIDKATIRSFSILRDYDKYVHLKLLPEYAMKQIVAQEKQDIFQICPTLSKSEYSKEPQYSTILEWYRVNKKMKDAYEETTKLLGHLILNLWMDREDRPEYLVLGHASFLNMFPTECLPVIYDEDCGSEEALYDLGKAAKDLGIIHEDSEIEPDRIILKKIVSSGFGEESAVADEVDYDQLVDLIFYDYDNDFPSCSKCRFTVFNLDYNHKEVNQIFVQSLLTEEELLNTLPSRFDNCKAKVEIFWMMKDFPIEKALFATSSHNSEGNLRANRFEIIWDAIKIATGGEEASPKDVCTSNLSRQASLCNENSILIYEAWKDLPDCTGVVLDLEQIISIIEEKQSNSP